jgi:phytoene desaturase
MQKKILIIGAGLSGLAVACRLAACGHQVSIFEKRDKPGGKASVFKVNDFIFDTGPTQIHMPFLVDEVFNLGGKKREDYFDFLPLDPYYQVIDPSGRSFRMHADEQVNLDQIGQLNPDDVAGYQRLLEASEEMYRRGFAWMSRPASPNRVSLVRHIPKLLRLQPNKPVDQVVSGFIKDEFLQKAFSLHAPLIFGGSPYTASSLYTMMHSIEQEWGVHYPIGGVGRMVHALTRLFGDLGGRMHLGTEIVEILTQGRKAVGVRLADSGVEYSDRIIVSADSAHLYRQLLKRYRRRIYSSKRLDRMKYSASQFLLFFATRRRYLDQGLQHHNILLMPGLEERWKALFSGAGALQYPMLYLHMPTISDTTLAPEGHELFYASIPVPNMDTRIDWSKVAWPLRETMISFLEQNHLPNLRSNIVTETYLTPQYFQDELNCDKGAAYSFQPLFTQSGWFRSHNQSRELENLYLVGDGTSPGSGVHNAFISARIVDRLIQDV